MNVTLRKASALQNAINDQVKAVDTVTEVTVNEFQDAEAEIARAATKVKTNLARRDALIGALYQIRRGVGQANSAAGVDVKLAEVARLDKDIQFYTALAGKSERVAAEVLAGKLDKIRNRKDEGRASIYGYNDSVETSVLTAEDLAGFKALVNTAKKAKQRLQDELLELNVRTTVELSADTERVLRDEGLL